MFNAVLKIFFGFVVDLSLLNPNDIFFVSVVEEDDVDDDGRDVDCGMVAVSLAVSSSTPFCPFCGVFVIFFESEFVLLFPNESDNLITSFPSLFNILSLSGIIIVVSSPIFFLNLLISSFKIFSCCLTLLILFFSCLFKYNFFSIDSGLLSIHDIHKPSFSFSITLQIFSFCKYFVKTVKLVHFLNSYEYDLYLI